MLDSEDSDDATGVVAAMLDDQTDRPEETQPARDSEYYFDDGSLVLRCEDTLFRVSMLACNAFGITLIGWKGSQDDFG
jgi:hypothetical protein